MSVPTIIWITKRDSLVDALWFWNLRALRSHSFSPAPMFLLPADHIKDWMHFPAILQAKLERPAEFTPDVVINSGSANQEELDSIARHLQLERPPTKKIKLGFRWPTEMRRTPFNYMTNVEVRPWLIFKRRYGVVAETEAHAVNGQTQLRFPSPVPFSTTGGYTLLQIDTSLFEGMPPRAVIANAISKHASWRHGRLQMRVRSTRSFRFDLKFPTLEDCVQLISTECTAGYKLSDKGRIGAAIISDFDTTLLLEPKVYESIVNLMTPRSKELERELKRMRKAGAPDADLLELAARWGGRNERRYRSVANIGLPGPRSVTDALESLCSLGWAERGFETDCKRCGLKSFVEMSSVSNAARCPACGAASAYSQNTVGIVTHYRLNAFIDRACDQGVIPHLLAIAYLNMHEQNTLLLAGTDVKFRDGSSGEIDLLGVHDGKLIAGEVKTSANEFTTEQIDKDIRKSVLLGVDTHILASINPVPDDTVEYVRNKTQAYGVDLLVLSMLEVRP
jgi:hypothetical protein